MSYERDASEFPKPRTRADKLALPVVVLAVAVVGGIWWFWPSHQHFDYKLTPDQKLVSYSQSPPSNEAFAQLIAHVPVSKLEDLRLLRHAADAHRRDLVKILLTRGVSPDAREPLKFCDDLEAVRILVENGSSVKVSDSWQPPETVVEEDRQPRITRYLIDHGADPNASGGSLLTSAVLGGDVDMVRYLLSKGANPDITNLRPSKGQPGSLLEVAKKAGKTEIASLLEQARAGKRPGD